MKQDEGRMPIPSVARSDADRAGRPARGPLPQAPRLHLLVLVCLAIAVAAAGLHRGPGAAPAPLQAQPALCPPATILLPFLYRGSGLAYQPAPSQPTPDLRRPCPATPSPTRGPGTTTPGPEPTPTGWGSATTTSTATLAATVPVTSTPTLTVPVTMTTTASPALTATASLTPTVTTTPSPTSSPTPSASPTVTDTPGPSPTPTLKPEGVFGIQAFEVDLAPIVEGRMDGAGASWVRTRALWAGIEPADLDPPQRNWSATDSMIGAIRGRGLRPVVVIYTKPGWAASQSCGPVDRVPLQRYADFVGALVERYDGDGIDDAPGSPVARHWEIGNEPDLMDSQRGGEDYGSCFGDDPAAYGQQLRAAAQAIRAADPWATVIFGSVAYERFHQRPDFDPPGPFRYDFVRQVLTSLHQQHGTEPGFPFFDWMGFHNYNDYRNNWDDEAAGRPEIVGKAEHLRAEQLQVAGSFDLSDLPLFASEVGLPSGPADDFTQRGEDLQAVYLGQVMARSIAAGLEGAIWFTFSDQLPDPSAPRCDDLYFWLAHGLMRTRWMAEAVAGCQEPPLPGYTAGQDFVPKPALGAFAVAAGILSGAELDRRLSPAETGSAQIEAWRMRLRSGRLGLVAFTDNGERIGRRGFPPVVRDLTIDASILPDWTGTLRITDHLGNQRQESGSSVSVQLGQAPLYIETIP